MATPPKPISTLPPPRSKSSLCDTTPPVVLDSPAPPTPTPPTTRNGTTADAVTPAQTNPVVRKNGRRRYTPRLIPSAFRGGNSPANMSAARISTEADVAQFMTLTQQLNGQMDGLVEYHLTGGRWER